MRWMATVYASFKALMIAALAGQSGSAGAQSVNADDRAWDAVKASGSADACQQYLSEFPTGAHAEEAFRCLVEGILPAGSDYRQPTTIDIY
ncbi:MAG: hypothetical protein ACR2Q4_20705 [Geminicoccaceae bacterium]